MRSLITCHVPGAGGQDREGGSDFELPKFATMFGRSLALLEGMGAHASCGVVVRAFRPEDLGTVRSLYEAAMLGSEGGPRRTNPAVLKFVRRQLEARLASAFVAPFCPWPPARCRARACAH